MDASVLPWYLKACQPSMTSFLNVLLLLGKNMRAFIDFKNLCLVQFMLVPKAAVTSYL